MARYTRVLVKLSGGALSGSAEFGFDKSAVDFLADELVELADLGVQVAVVAGGGNIFRGRLVIFAGGTGQPYVTTDYPAVQRALEIRADVLLAAKHGVDGVFTADP